MTIPKLHHFAQQTIASAFPMDKQRNLKPWSKKNVAEDTEIIQELVRFPVLCILFPSFQLCNDETAIAKGEHTILLHVG